MATISSNLIGNFVGICFAYGDAVGPPGEAQSLQSEPCTKGLLCRPWNLHWILCPSTHGPLTHGKQICRLRLSKTQTPQGFVEL